MQLYQGGRLSYAVGKKGNPRKKDECACFTELQKKKTRSWIDRTLGAMRKVGVLEGHEKNPPIRRPRKVVRPQSRKRKGLTRLKEGGEMRRN